MTARVKAMLNITTIASPEPRMMVFIGFMIFLVHFHSTSHRRHYRSSENAAHDNFELKL
jgi:hypothetical protein